MRRATTDVNLACDCGTVRGRLKAISPAAGNHCVCYCDDCQAFAWFLERAGEVLDAHGGTRVFQVSPKRIEFTDGYDRVACMSLRPGRLLRWYADCCNTPLGNTPASTGLPIVGVIHRCIRDAADGRPLEAVLGPVRDRVFGRYARSDRSTLDAPDGVRPSSMFRLLRMLLAARLRGDIRHSPFHDTDGRPRAAPRVLTAAELRGVEARRDAGH